MAGPSAYDQAQAVTIGPPPVEPLVLVLIGATILGFLYRIGRTDDREVNDD